MKKHLRDKIEQVDDLVKEGMVGWPPPPVDYPMSYRTIYWLGYRAALKDVGKYDEAGFIDEWPWRMPLD